MQITPGEALEIGAKTVVLGRLFLLGFSRSSSQESQIRLLL